MKKRAAILLLLGVSLAAWAWIGAWGQQPASQDEQAIRKAIDAYTAAFDKGEADGLLAHFAADAEYIDESGKQTRGRDALTALFKKQFAGLKGFKIKFNVKSLRFLKGEVALEDGVAELTAPDGTVSRSPYSSVWTKTDGKWLLTQVRDLAAVADGPGSARHEQLKDLEWLVGDWVSEDKDNPATLTCRWTLHRHFLHLEFGAARQDGTPAEVSLMMGWDPLSDKLKSWFFDARGGYGEAGWTRQGNSWKATALGVLPDGRKASGTHTIKFLNDKSFVLQLSDREVEGLPLADADLKFARKGAKP